jgi:hypothetical protein
MKAPIWISALFWISAVYDAVLGAAFLVAPNYPFDLFEVDRPNHAAYVQFPAALMIVFAVMFLAIAVKPVANRHLILYGILLKVAFVVVAGGHWLTADIPAMWKPLIVIDLAMAVLFALSYFQLGKIGTSESEVSS